MILQTNFISFFIFAISIFHEKLKSVAETETEGIYVYHIQGKGRDVTVNKKKYRKLNHMSSLMMKKKTENKFKFTDSIYKHYFKLFPLM